MTPGTSAQVLPPRADTTVQPPRERRPPLAVAAAAWVLLAVLLQILRSAHTPVWDSIWSEDGRFFYSEARAEPGWTLLFRPTQGYVQVVPRFLAWIAAQFSTVHAALAISLLATLTAALLSLYVFIATEEVLPQRWQRYAVAALVVLSPAAAYEVNGTINNLHWYLMFAAFWACLSRSTSPRRVALDTAVVVLAALSDPLTAVLLPLVLIRLRSRARAVYAVIAGLLLGLATQALLVDHSQSVVRHPRQVADLPVVYALRVWGGLLVGDRGVNRLWDGFGGVFVVTVTLVVGLGLALAISRATVPERRLLLALVAYSGIFFAAPLLLRGGEGAYLHHPTTDGPSRYLAIPLWLGYSALIVAAGERRLQMPSLRQPTRAALLPLLVIGLLGAQLLTNFAPPSVRTLGPSWKASVARARLACASAAVPRPARRPRDQTQPILLAPDQVALPVPPYWAWFYSVRLRCEQLDR